ncbi:hypothetical protein F5887DRAFT_1135551, partial [Amanita rubescens]
ITRFFAQFPKFDYDPTAPVNQEYRHLRDSNGGPKKKRKLSSRRSVERWGGSNVHDVRAWRALCAALGVNSIPKTIEECKTVAALCAALGVNPIHVNLVGFIDTRITGQPVETFETEELREYTVEEGKYYPKESAKESGVLKHLLRKNLSLA